jgi:MerR family transcriptional regulator, thiopeptide resistance regulator
MRVHRQEAKLNRDTQYRSAAETAALLGVTTKALRVYERHGLVTPVRSGAGYRAYGPTQMRRLHQVLALKSLGLSLAQIGNCLDGLDGDLGPILEAQEKDLRSRADALAAALASVVAARARLAAGQSLSVDDLVTLTKDIVMTTGKTDWREALAPLFAKHFTEAERAGIMRPASASAGGEASAERAKLLAEAKALVGKDPGAPEALQLARRWRDRAAKFTAGDKAMLKKLQAVFDDALADPAISKTLPWREEMAFIKAATERLEAAGQ